MKSYDLITPEGTRDLLFDECVARKEAEDKLRAVFTAHGYSEVITPALEFYDVFNNKTRSFRQEDMYKLTDGKGRLMVMRPDSTMPIARIVATRLRDGVFPLKLFCSQNIYRCNPKMAGRDDEFMQSGVEIIGGDEKRSDLEALSLAAQVLNSCSSDDVRLEIGDNTFYKLLLEKLDIDKALLPKVYESPEVTGVISEKAAKRTGLAAGTIVVGGAGDNAAAAVGTGVVEDGKAFTTIGTSGVVFAHTDNISIDPKGRVHTFCCAVPGAWHVMGVTQGAGLSLKWFRDNFCGAEKETAAGMGVDPYYLMDQQAARSPIGCNRLLYLPYLMGERTPHLDPDCRGAFIGLSAMHTKYDMLRAVMEGVTYSQRDSVEVLKTMGVSIDGMLACGGGGSSKLWRQMLADTYNCAVRTVVSKEGPALGVAILAGVGAGLYPSVQEGCRRVIRLNAPQEPIEENVPKYEAFYRMYTKLYPALKDCYKELAAL